MDHEIKRTPVRDISLIRRGDRIEACRGDHTCYRGDVKDTAPGVGVLGIREEDSHGRRAVSLDDFTILRVPRQQQPRGYKDRCPGCRGGAAGAPLLGSNLNCRHHF